MPRATTAACEVMPPRVVRMPSAACMPWMSSGEVSTRTRMTFLSLALSASALSEENTISPDAAPGEAGSPVAMILRSELGSMVGCRSWSSAPGSMRMTASLRVIRPSLASSTAILRAAFAVRLPKRVCSIHSLPCSSGEFEVLHVAVVALEHAVDAGQLVERRRHRLFHRRLAGAGLLARELGDLLRGADAGDHVFALGIDQELAVELPLPGRGIARERRPRGRGLAHIAEHHGLHIDRGAPALRDVVQAP